MTKLEDLMKTQKLSQRKLAKIMGISQPALSSIMRRDGDPRLSSLRRLARAMGCDLATVIAHYDDPFAVAPEEYDDPWL
jgi:transcriptional regulator with XRE-family HTH domain